MREIVSDQSMAFVASIWSGGDVVRDYNVAVRLTWDSSSPYQISMSMYPGQPGETIWCYGRDLAVSGTHSFELVGDGDVRIRTSIYRRNGDGQVFIHLNTDEASCFVALDRLWFKDFLSRTASVVPIGEESCIISDSLLEKVLNSWKGSK